MPKDLDDLVACPRAAGDFAEGHQKRAKTRRAHIDIKRAGRIRPRIAGPIPDTVPRQMIVRSIAANEGLAEEISRDFFWNAIGPIGVLFPTDRRVLKINVGRCAITVISIRAPRRDILAAAV